MTAYLSACEGYASEHLLPLVNSTISAATRLVGRRLIAGISFAHTYQPLCELMSVGDDKVLLISQGWLVRSLYQCEAFHIAWLSTVVNRVHMTSFTHAFERETIEYVRRGLRKLTFEMAKPLEPLFVDRDQERAQFADAVAAVESAFLSHLTRLYEGRDRIWPAAPTEYCDQLVHLSTIYTVYHEAAHAALDHDDLEAVRVAQSAGSSPPLTDAALRRAMELDADVQALGWMLRDVGDDVDLLGWIFFAFAVTLVSFDVGHRSVAEYQESSHPLPDFRYVLAVDFWGHRLDDLGLRVTPSQYRAAWQTQLCRARMCLEQMMIAGAGFPLIGNSIHINWDPAMEIEVRNFDPAPIRFNGNFAMTWAADAELRQLTQGLMLVQAGRS